MDWKNLLLGIGGAIAAPFTGGATLPLVGAALSAHGAQSAADQQKASGQQAINTEKEYSQQALNRLDQASQQQQALFAPYTALGAGAGATLAQGLGISLPKTTSPVAIAKSAGASPFTAAPGGFSATPEAARQYPTILNSGGGSAKAALTAVDPARFKGALSGPLGRLLPQAQAQIARQSSYTNASPGQGTVTLMAPNGETKEIPNDPAQIQHYVSLGAKVVQ